jgi:hypothetical protein
MQKRIVRVNAYGASSQKVVSVAGANYSCHAAAGDTVVYQFPPGIIDLSTLRFFFKYARLGVASNDTVPKDTETLIDELEVTLGDTVVNKIANYQQLFFMLSGYAMDADWVLGTQTYQRIFTNRRCSTANVIGWQFGMEEFLGLLGSKQVIDTRKFGRLTVRMRLGPSASVASSTAANSWGFNDPFFRVHYLEHDAPSVDRVRFDDFTGMRQSFPGYDGRTTLVVDGRRRLYYCLARQVTVANHDSKGNGFDGNTGLTARFTSTANNIGSWDFLVNNAPAHAYEPAVEEGLLSMREVFPDGIVNLALTGNPGMDNCFYRGWAAGFRLDLPQREDGQQNEVSFETTAVNAAAATTPQYTFLFAPSRLVVTARPFWSFE